MSSIGESLFGGYKTGYKNPTASVSRGTGSRVEETVQDVNSYPFKSIPERGISEKTAERFGIRTKVSAKDGLTPEAHYFPYTLEGKVVGYKKRDLTIPKQQKGHFSTIGFQSVACDLFGLDGANKSSRRMIFITEGEYDAAVLWQCLRENYKGKEGTRAPNFTVVSISNGTSNAVQNLAQKSNYKLLSKFENVIVAFDGDRATEAEKAKGIMKGKDATAAVYSVIPEMKVVDIPEDLDPCDMYNKGLAVQLYWAAMKPKEYIPDGFSTYSQFREKAHEIPKLGRNFPWPTLTRLTLGKRDGEGMFVGAGVKMGKSEFLNQNVENDIRKDEDGQRRKAAVFKFEEENDVTCKKIAGKIYHKDFVNAEKVMITQEDGTYRDIWGNEVFVGQRGYFTHEELIEATDEVGDNLIYFNNYGRAVWDEVKGAIRHAVLVEGCKDIYIDPITRLVQGLSPSDANTELERFSDELSKLAKELEFWYCCFCHLNAPNTGKPHEFGGQVQSAQFAGSRAMMRNTYYMVGIERNKDPSLSPKQRNTSWIVVLDDRKHGRAGKFPVFYDTDTGDYLEPPEGFLDSPYETLKEWYAVNPEDNPRHENYKAKEKDLSQPLSEENKDKQYADLEETDIPAEASPPPEDLGDDQDDGEWDDTPF